VFTLSVNLKRLTDSVNTPLAARYYFCYSHRWQPGHLSLVESSLTLGPKGRLCLQFLLCSSCCLGISPVVCDCGALQRLNP
jgi:hypothetical protein